MHGDAPPTAPGSAIAGFYLNVLGHAVGWPSPRGGAGRLTDALVAYLEELGGELRLSAPVTAVETIGDRVSGVVVAGEERIPARTVVADVMPHALIELTGDALRGTYRSLLKRYRYGASTLKVDWALDGPIPWENEEVRRAGTVHVAGDEDELLEAVAHVPRRGCPSARSCSAASRPSPTRPARPTASTPPGPTPTARRCARDLDWDAHVERVEAQIERFAPGFRDRIVARHVLDPREPRGAATRTSSAATSAAAPTRCARSSSAPSRSCPPTRRRSPACSSAPPPPSPAVPSTACPATPPPAPPCAAELTPPCGSWRRCRR